MCTKTDDEGRLKNTFKMTKQEVELFRQTGGGNGKIVFQASVRNKNL
ncbi:unnamed protein product, partial [Rotaria sp. Silwood2]